MVRKMRFALALIFLFTAFSLSACNSATHLSPGLPSEVSSADLTEFPSSETLLGVYSVTIDPLTRSVSMEPLVSRNADLGEQYLGDITGFLTSIFCTDCARIDSMALTETGLIDLAISVRHPFGLPMLDDPPSRKRLDLHLFDLFGEVYTEDGSNFEQAGITINPRFLVNADGYTGIYDPLIDKIFPTRNDYHPYKVFFEDSSEGNFNPNDTEYGFTDPFFPSGHNVFPQGSDFKTTHFILNPRPGTTINFSLVLTASYGISAKFNIPYGQFGNRLMPRYFLPRFNRYEPWKMTVSVPDYLNFLTSNDPDQEAEIRIDVWDWQDGVEKSNNWNFLESRNGEITFDSNVDRIEIYSSELLNEPLVVDGSESIGVRPRSFTIPLRNEKQAPVGKYWGLACAIDELDTGYSLLGFKRDGRTPFPYNKLRIYQPFRIEVKSNSSAVPDNPIDVTPMVLNGYLTDLIVYGGYGYASAGVLGVIVFDITNSANPFIVTTVDTPGKARQLCLSYDGTRLFVADSKAGLVIINILDPETPFIEGTYDDSVINDACSVGAYGDFVYLGDSESGIVILNVSNPSHPDFLGHYANLPEVRALEIYNDYLYKLDAKDGLEILALSNPASPAFVKKILIDGTKRDLDIDNDVGMILLKNRLITASFTDPENPVLKGSLTIDPWGQDVDLVNGLGWVANGVTGVQIIATENLTDPHVLTTFNTSGYAWAVSVQDSIIYVADGDGGLVALTTSGGDLNLQSTYKTIGRAIGTSVYEENVYVTSGYSGLKTLDIISPESATITSMIKTEEYAYDCDAVNETLYVADSYQGFAVFNIEDASDPVYMQNIQISGWDNWLATGIKADRNTVAVYGPQSNPEVPDLLLYSLTDPWSPSLASEISLPDSVYDVSLNSNWMYLAAGVYGIVPMNIEQPGNPETGDIYSNGKDCMAVSAVGDRMSAMYLELGLETYDITTPSHPDLVGGAVTLGNTNDTCLSGDYVYANSDSNLMIFDVTYPAYPQFVTTVVLQDDIREIIVRGNYAYIANWDAGLRILKLW
jgi:hypothetical protein